MNCSGWDAGAGAWMSLSGPPPSLEKKKWASLVGHLANDGWQVFTCRAGGAAGGGGGTVEGGFQRCGRAAEGLKGSGAEGPIYEILSRSLGRSVGRGGIVEKAILPSARCCCPSICPVEKPTATATALRP